jgi:predicted N-acetyltransferase YhbS
LSYDTSRPILDTYRPGDEEAILACLRASFGAEPRAARWRHLHLENPAGRSLIVLARDGDEVIGQIATLRRTIRFFDDACAVGHVVDTMVHPRWQGRGVFQEMIAASESLTTEAGLVASYGVANDSARHGASKYELRRPLGPFPILVRPLRPLASLAALARRSVSGDAGGLDVIPECAAAGPVAHPADGPRIDDVATSVWTPPRFDGRHSALFADAEGLPPIAFVRDANHLRWRYASGDGAALYAQRDLVADGQVAATTVVRLVPLGGLRLLFVMEWHWRTGAAAAGQAVLRDALELARRADAHGVAAMAGRGTPHRRAMQRLGFLAVPSRLFPTGAWPGVHPRGRHAHDPRWLEPANWYSTWGDGLVI